MMPDSNRQLIGWDEGHLVLRVEQRFLLRIINDRTACVVMSGEKN